MEKISVCMATFNGATYLRQQIDSIMLQLRKNDELIISDDSSTDATVSLIQSYNDARIKIFEGQKFRNPVTNFEHALQQACGHYIFLADQDDVWHPEKIKCMLPHIIKHGLAVCDASLIDRSGITITKSFMQLNKSGKGFVRNLIKNSYIGCCMGFSQSLLARALPFPKNIPMHDSWIGLLGELYYKPVFLPDCLVYYRRHGSNISASGEKSKNTLVKKLKLRAQLMTNIIQKVLQPDAHS